MSYRSFKRVLGETSLERKCHFLFGACLLLLITASFWLYGKRTEMLVYEPNVAKGALLVDQAMLIRHFEVFKNEKQKLSENELAVNRELVEAVRVNLNKEQYQTEFIRPNRSEELGPYERWLVKNFLKSERGRQAKDPGQGAAKRPASKSGRREATRYAYQTPPSTNRYEYYQPIYVDKLCVDCHRGMRVETFESSGAAAALQGGLLGGTLQEEGELIAIAKVTISNEETQYKVNQNRALLLVTAIITVFLAMLASYAIVRYVIVKPLRHLRDVSDEISRGNMALRADIRTGDEFEALAVAFNRMLRHLVTIQEELRQANVSLDGKVDELAQANMQLYEMNRIKSDFLATMSHELRTPLNSILGFSDVLGGIASLDGKQKRYVENIQKSGRMLLDMINDILDLAKIESGKAEIRLTDFHIEQVVGAQCDMARPLTEKKNIDLDTIIEPDLPPLHQDQARVQQILNNLLSNAIKFTPEGGRITISAAREAPDRLVLQVIDTGVGIAEEDQEAIFEKFRQGRNPLSDGSSDAITREYSGSGLGLSIVKELCKLLGGEVAVQSQLGKGSTFTIRLPWSLKEQPRLESSVTEEFEQVSRLQIHGPRGHGADAEEPQPQTAD